MYSICIVGTVCLCIEYTAQVLYAYILYYTIPYYTYVGILARGGGGAAVVHQGQHQRQATE